MPRLLRRNRSFLRFGRKLARTGCRSACCDPPRFARFVNCCYPSEWFWFMVSPTPTLCADGTPLHQPGQPAKVVRFGADQQCHETRPGETPLTAAQIVAQEPSPRFAPIGFNPPCEGLTCREDPCDTCPECCVPAQVCQCNRPEFLCCEWTLPMEFIFTWVRRRVRRAAFYPLAINSQCPQCRMYTHSAVVTEHLEGSTFSVRVRFTCDPDTLQPVPELVFAGGNIIRHNYQFQAIGSDQLTPCPPPNGWPPIPFAESHENTVITPQWVAANMPEFLDAGFVTRFCHTQASWYAGAEPLDLATCSLRDYETMRRMFNPQCTGLVDVTFPSGIIGAGPNNACHREQFVDPWPQGSTRIQYHAESECHRGKIDLSWNSIDPPCVVCNGGDPCPLDQSYHDDGGFVRAEWYRSVTPPCNVSPCGGDGLAPPLPARADEDLDALRRRLALPPRNDGGARTLTVPLFRRILGRFA